MIAKAGLVLIQLENDASVRRRMPVVIANVQIGLVSLEEQEQWEAGLVCNM